MKKLALLLLSSVGLYGQWITGFYAAQNGILPISGIPWNMYTHIIHFAAAPNSDGSVALHYLTAAEIGAIMASRPEGKKVIVAIKDNDSDLSAFPAATSPGTIATFVDNVVNFVNASGYDGVDLDWEANVNVTQCQDLLKRLRSAMPTKAVLMDAGNWGGLEKVAAGAASAIDQVNVMCYDMDNPSVGYSWFNDALLQNGDPSLMTCDWRVRSLTNAGLAPSKIGIGIPYYGRRWPGVTQPLVAGSFNPSWFRYADLVTDGTRWQPENKFHDSGHQANYLSIPSLNEFDSYNGVEFIQDAVAWQKTQGFGGFMTFTVDYEYLPDQTGDAQYPLSATLHNAVFGASPPQSGPQLSSGSPIGTLNTSTTSTTLSVVSNVNATCRYATATGTAYSAMPYLFAVTGSTTHSTALVSLRSNTTYNYYVKCQDTLGIADTQDYPITFSIAASTTSSGPTPLSVTPNSGSGSTQTFDFQVSDPNGYTDIQQFDVVIDTATGQTNSCRLEYWAPTNTLLLQSDDTTSWVQAALGSPTILRNSQCSINPVASSVSGAGTVWDVKLAIAFASNYVGTKSILVFASGPSVGSGWVTLGTWIPATAPPPTVTGTAPTVHLSPNTGSGSSATFALGITDSGGYSNVLQGALFIGNTLGAANSCYIDYWASTNTLSLLSDDTATWSHATVGSSVLMQNSQCAVNPALATVSGSGNTLTVKFPVTFSTNYKGGRTLYSFGANKAGQSSGWQKSGTWTVNVKKR